MKPYHKIKSLWARSDEKPHNILVGQYSCTEFETLANAPWIWTEKIDGTNIRVMWDGYKVSFGGRTNNAQIPTSLYAKLEEVFGGEANAQKFEELFGEDPACLYGEGFGNKIQSVGSQYIPEGVDFILFDVHIGRMWLERVNVTDIAHKLDIPVVAQMGQYTPWFASDLVKNGHLISAINSNVTIEGLVGTPKAGLLDRKGNRIIAKLKHKDFIQP
jgi:hypothetical protein